MPAKTERQVKFMNACAHGANYSSCPSEAAAKEFERKDSQEEEVITELTIARDIALGLLKSPQKYENMWLFALRITGTGTAYREKNKEFVYREPDNYLNDHFLQRCMGLSVIWEHPEEKKMMDTKEFVTRTVGQIFLPYILEEEREVWGIAKIYDEEAASKMEEKQLSTSPGVVFSKLSDNVAIDLGNGESLLLEGIPILLDHLAICKEGVWDKLQGPSGVLNESNQEDENQMFKNKYTRHFLGLREEEKEQGGGGGSTTTVTASQDTELLKGIKASLDALTARQDSNDKKLDALQKRFDSQEEEDKEKEKEEETKEEKKDSSEDLKGIKERLDSLDADIKASKDSHMPVSDEEAGEMTEIQARADSVLQKFGMRAQPPLLGERKDAYRKRLLKGLMQHSPTLKDVKLDSIKDAGYLELVERQVYFDAQTVADNPGESAGQGLIPIKTRTEDGRVITSFRGNISAFTGQFKSGGSIATGFNTGRNH